MLIQASVERAAAKAEFLGGAEGVAVAAGESLFDQEGLDFLQAHIFQTRRGLPGVEREISEDTAPTKVWVIPTDEELLIARDTLRVILKIPHP